MPSIGIKNGRSPEGPKSSIKLDHVFDCYRRRASAGRASSDGDLISRIFSSKGANAI
jgi:hypothetical protein